MFPGMGGVNPKQMQALMKQMGIKSDDVAASKVVIHKKDGSQIVIENPSVTAIEMKGDKSFQISGDVTENQGGELTGSGDDSSPSADFQTEESGPFTDNDVQMVSEQAKVSSEKARKMLGETGGDIAEAILKLENGE